MTDWAKLKVTDLKEECKARGIPLTGLKLKQQYIDKLEEHEAADASGPTSNDSDPAAQEGEENAQTNGHSEETPHEPVITDSNGDNVEQEAETTEKDEPSAQQEADEIEHTSQTHGEVQTTDTKGETSEKDEAEEDKPAELREEDNHAGEALVASEEPSDKEQLSVQPAGADAALSQSESAKAAETLEATQHELAQSSNENVQAGDGGGDLAEQADAPVKEADSASREPEVQAHVPQSAQRDEIRASSQISPSDIIEDQKKRRKRSATPVPTSEEVARKKARLSTAGDDLKPEEISVLAEMKAATEEAKEIQNETDGATIEGINEQVTATTAPLEKSDAVTSRDVDQTQPASPVRPSDERDVPPAIHPATSSLYIRNFKRPLHIPSLRSHIVSLAKSPTSSDDTDPITVFYLDSIRTHAFVSFNSVAAASRVRTAMHDTRFPDEAMREPLFIDYIPDDKVQAWIDRETGGGGFGRGGGGRRYEVVYEQVEGGVEAVFQEIDSSKPRPPVEPSRASRMSVDRPKAEPVAAAVHPDRAPLVPRGPQRDDHQDAQGRAPPTGPKNAGNTGRGFKELDELFKSTTTKPKLYYKPVSEAEAAERLDMFRQLRPGYADMGRSGDEGMKRYSFERYKDREEWVDKGPEFGFGKLGQDRLAGIRGRGGFRGRGGGDSWRGRSGR